MVSIANYHKIKEYEQKFNRGECLPENWHKEIISYLVIKSNMIDTINKRLTEEKIKYKEVCNIFERLQGG